MPWLKTEYYDFDEEKEMVGKYNVDEKLPVFIFLDNNGNEIQRMHGEVSKKELVEFINQNKDK